MEIKQIKYIGEKTLSYVIEKCKATFALITHKHTAEEVGADASGSAASALGLSNQYTDEKVAEITSGDTVVKESEHSSTADTATNAENAVNAEHATSADTATTADSATKATQDASGNIITDTYETKEDAIAKFDELAAKSVMLVAATKTDDVWSTDKTFAEIQAHIQGGGTAVLCEDGKYLNFTTSSETNVIFSCIDIINETYVMPLGLGGSNSPNLMEITFVISSDNTITDTKKLLSVADVEAHSLVTEDKTIAGAINEVCTKALTQSDWNVNDENDVAFIKNRTHYDYIETKEVTLTYDGILENHEHFEYSMEAPRAAAMNKNYMVKLSNEVPTDVSAFIDSTCVVVMEETEDSYVITQDTITKFNDDAYAIGSFLVAFNDTYIDMIGKNVTKGIYSSHRDEYNPITEEKVGCMYAKQLTYTGDFEVVKKIDDRFQHQSDWNVNDKDSAAYISNKPFYEEEYTGEIVICEYDSLVISGTDIDYVLSEDLIEGKTYTVVWNNTTYECVATMDGYDDICIGNISLSDESDNVTSEPFCFTSYNGWTNVYVTTPGTYSMKVSYNGTRMQVSELDEKYISYVAGRKVTGQAFLKDEVSVIAGDGAEIFNDYIDNVATGQYSHAEGYYTTAHGHSSHAEGQYTIASAADSHAEGFHTIAASENQHVQGKYNIEDTNRTYAHIVGNGNHTKHSNAHTLDWSGNAWYQGSVEATAMILVSPNGTRFSITVGDDGVLKSDEIVE